MKNKKSVVFIFLFLLAFTVVKADSVNINNRVTLSVTSSEPEPAKPGQYLDVYLSLSVPESNARDVRLNNLNIEAIPEYPLSVFPGTSRTAQIGNVREGEFRTLKFRLWVDENADPGNARLRFKYSSDDGESELSAPLEFAVQRSDPGLAVSKVKLEPEMINQGSIAKMILTLNNPTGGVMSDVRIKLGLPDEITPVGETDTKRIKLIESGKTGTLTFGLLADSSADAGAYKVPIEIAFSDAQGTSYSRNETLGILVGSTPKLQVDLDDQEVFTPGASGNIVVGISNIGPSDVKFMSLEILENPNLDLLSPNRIYMGDLAPDDFETAQFKIHVKSIELSNLQVKLSYNDAFNEPVQEFYSVPISIYSSRDASKYGLTSPQSGVFVKLFYVLMVLFVFQWYRNWRREKDLVKGFTVSLKKDLKLLGGFLVWILRGFKRKRR